MKYFIATVIFTLFCTSSYAKSEVQLIKKENPDSNTTLLVIGGIHGNEPGGYFTASILASHYTILSKNLWIVPNLNKESIIHNNRGIHGDMNRKFASIKPNDKDKAIVDKIKQIILSKNVSLVINLHDGHGFYRKKYHGSIFNPNAWGQTCVIDQCKLPQDQPFGNLNEIALKVKENLNNNLLQNHHVFDVRNTNTKFDDEAMQLSLTFFAVTNNKPAFAIESSKNLSTLSQKVFYQLLAIEEFMNVMGIKYKRNFDLSTQGLNKILDDYGTLTINNNLKFKLSNIRNYLNYIPLKTKDNSFIFSHNIGAVKYVRGVYMIYIGNKRITTLKPQYFNLATACPQTFQVDVDGKMKDVNAGEDLFVDKYFNIKENKDLRVNIIGFTNKGKKDESNVNISIQKIDKRYSVDNDYKIYRAEFYKDEGFCFASMVHFK